MWFDDDVTGNDNCHYDRTEDEPEDKVKPGIFVWEHIKERWKPAVEFVKCTNRCFLTSCDTPSEVVFFLIGIVAHDDHYPFFCTIEKNMIIGQGMIKLVNYSVRIL